MHITGCVVTSKDDVWKAGNIENTVIYYLSVKMPLAVLAPALHFSIFQSSYSSSLMQTI